MNLLRTIIIVVFLTTITCGYSLDDPKSSFQDFIQKYNKKYSDEKELERRYNIFKENLIKINGYQQLAETHNLKSKYGVTKFTDMTEEEFKRTMLLPPISDSSQPCSVSTKSPKEKVLNVDGLPDSFDWRSKGAVTEVKDQGTVGTCWAFSTTGNIEGQWFLNGNPLISLSEEQLSDCDKWDCGVFGGYPCRAYQYVMEVGGLMSEKDYPYCVGTGACYPCSPTGYNETFCGPGPTYCNATQWPCKARKGSSNFVAHISNWRSISDNETEIAAELVSTGPLSVLLDASGIPPLQFHEWGVYDPISCDPSSLDHAVLIVGYGVESGVFSDTPYWLVKNSWGTDWSDSGYFKIRRGSGTCGINRAVTTSII